MPGSPGPHVSRGSTAPPEPSNGDGGLIAPRLFLRFESKAANALKDADNTTNKGNRMSAIAVGDSVFTLEQMYFVEAIHPKTGDEIETRLPRRHCLTVCGVDTTEGTIDVQLPDGYVATLSRDSVEL